jgi:hypothetical protein
MSLLISCHSLRVATLFALLFLPCCCSSRCSSHYSSHTTPLAHYSFHTTLLVLQVLRRFSHVVSLMMCLSCCNCALLFSRCKSSFTIASLVLFFPPCCSFHTVIPLMLLFLHHRTLYVLVNLISVALLLLPLLFLCYHCCCSRVVALFCLVSMVLPLPLPCASRSSKLRH